MSFRRHAPLTPADERFLIVRTMVVQCAPGVRTTSDKRGWHRLIAAAEGVLIVRTSQGAWSTPAANAVWTPAGMRYELEICRPTALRVLYLRSRRSARVPANCCVISVSPLLRELIVRIAALPALDRRLRWHVALNELVQLEVRAGARAPQELVWPRDPRLAEVATSIQNQPADNRPLAELCAGKGISARTAQRLFPLQTGLTFEEWRTRQRFLQATRLLSEGRKVIEVAERCGYRSPSAFVAAFRRFAGVTPGEYCRTSLARSL